MALGAHHVTVTTAANFIPEVWSDEIIAAYEKKLVAANLFKSMDFVGKKGDTIHIPTPSRATAAQKLAQTAVDYTAATEGEVQVLINQHWYVARIIEDIVKVQALGSMRQFYTEDLGYSLARKIDSDLLALGRGFNGGTGTAAYSGALSGADGTTAYVAGANTGVGALTDAAIRRTIQRLDDNDVPEEGRFLIVPPSSRNTLMGLARFTEQAFVGETGSGNTIRNGKIGDLYGVPVYVTSNADTTSGSTATRIALLGHRDAAVLVQQMKPRVKSEYDIDYLADKMVSDVLYGVKELRDGSAFALAVPA